MMHMMLVTHLGPSPLYLPPSCPFSSQSIPMICCTLLWLLCTRCTFIWVVWCMATCSSCTVCTLSRVHWVRIHLAWVDHLPLQRQWRCLPWTSESTGFTFVSLKNGTSNLTLTLHCTTNMHALGACTSVCAFPFPFPLPDATSSLSNPVGLNDMDMVACHSSLTCRATSTFHTTSSHHAAASVFHLAHNRCASSIFAMTWLATRGSIPWSLAFWRLTCNKSCNPVSSQLIWRAPACTSLRSHRAVHISCSSSNSSLSSGIDIPSVNTASAVVMISSVILAFLALASVGRVRARMAWNDMLLMGVVHGDVEMSESRDDRS